jgi:PPIC-type PPIASE domain
VYEHLLNRHLALWLVTLSLACSGKASLDPGSAVGAANAGPVSQSTPIPSTEVMTLRAAHQWRLAPVEDFGRVTLWVSHILVRHAQTQRAAPFAPDWLVLPPPPGRSREEAKQLASDIQRRAAAGAEPFSDLARRLSEDSTTAERGGDLGPITASALRMYRSVMDALVALPPRGISEVVETPFGFHVMMRNKPPIPEQVAGRRIVIGYADATWLEFGKRSPQRPMRDRAAALELAREIAERAAVAPNDFQRLVVEHSEHWDADEKAGDMGVWTLGEPTVMGREIQTLASLSVGESSQPIDTFLGFVLVQRTAVAKREAFAMSIKRFSFPADERDIQLGTKAQAYEKALEFRAGLAKPDHAIALEQEMQTLAWFDGRGPRNLTNVLRNVKVGDLLPEPVLSDYTYVVGRRLPADVGSVLPALSDVPTPASPDVEYWLPRLIEAELPALKRRIVPQMRDVFRTALLIDDHASEVLCDHIHQILSNAWTVQQKTQRAGAVAGALAEIRTIIGANAYAAYHQALAEYLAERLLGGSPS